MAMYDPNQYIINNYLSDEQPGTVMQDAPTGMNQANLNEGSLATQQNQANSQPLFENEIQFLMKRGELD